MNQQVSQRIAFGALAIAALVGGWLWFQEWSKDPENEAKAQTAGMVAAIEVLPDGGSQTVVYKSDGTRVATPNPEKGREDREINWGATGAHVFISSNREENAYNIYRWNPATGSFAKRSYGSRSQGAPWFVQDGTVESLRTGLFVAGGTVNQLDPKVMKQNQILPPLAMMTDQEDGGGAVSPMSGAFKDLGNSFKDAKWGPKKEVVYSVMRRDEGEVLVVTVLTPGPNGQPIPPTPVIAGRRIGLDVAPNGAGVVTVEEFQWPNPAEVPEEFIKNGRVTTPYRNAIFLLKAPDESGGGGGFAPMLIFPPTDPVFPAEASISPDGKQVAVVLNQRKGDNVSPVGLILFPAEEGAGNKGQPLVQGSVASPSWAPNNSQIVYLKIEGGERSIRLFNLRTGTDARISEAGRSYRTPKMSPAIEE